jgi:AcrR family transcriptional regulator
LKTRDRILAAARLLFNEQGVSALSALDIATSMGISPGHLYYHFKGKPEIVDCLLAEYEAEITLILHAAVADCRGPNATLETLWTHVHILVEEACDVSFFYREAGALAFQQPLVAGRIRKILTAQRAALARLLAELNRSGAIIATPEIVDGLSRTLNTGIGFHVLELELEGDRGPPRQRMARAAAQLMLPIVALAPKTRR